MPRRTDKEIGRAVRLAMKGKRIKPRRLFYRDEPDGYEECDRDYFDNNSDIIEALLEALTPLSRLRKSLRKDKP